MTGFQKTADAYAENPEIQRCTETYRNIQRERKEKKRKEMYINVEAREREREKWKEPESRE